MGLGPAAIKLNLELWQRGIFKDIHSVIEIGAQGLHIALTDLEELIHMAGMDSYNKERFKVLKKYPNGPGCSSRPFYEILGIKDYSAVDLNKLYGSVPLDLNYPLKDKSLYGRYDLVTDYGTNEHIYNTSEAYRTMHRLCKVGGILIICQVVYRGNGYYAYNPRFFEEMAAANHYNIISSSYIVVTATSTKNGSSNQFHLPISNKLLDTLDWSKITELGIFYVMQKQKESEFNMPAGGKYSSEFQQNHGYMLQFLQEPPSSSYIPVNTPDNIGRCVSGKALLTELFTRKNKKAV